MLCGREVVTQLHSWLLALADRLASAIFVAPFKSAVSSASRSIISIVNICGSTRPYSIYDDVPGKLCHSSTVFCLYTRQVLYSSRPRSCFFANARRQQKPKDTAEHDATSHTDKLIDALPWSRKHYRSSTPPKKTQPARVPRKEKPEVSELFFHSPGKERNRIAPLTVIFLLLLVKSPGTVRPTYQNSAREAVVDVSALNARAFVLFPSLNSVPIQLNSKFFPSESLIWRADFYLFFISKAINHLLT